jgi:integrase
MAWAEKLPTGLYVARWRDGADHKRSRSGFAQRAAALRYAGEQESRTRRGERGYQARGPTWGDWLPIWLDLRTVEPSTAKHDLSRIDRYLLPYWYTARLGQITRTDAQRWVNQLGKELSPSTTRRVFAVFSASMSAAVRAGHVGANPCQTVDLPTAATGHEHYLTRAEFDAVASFLNEPYRTAAILLAGCGLRFGEMAGLHWWRVDLEAGELVVAETWDATARQVKAYPKGRKAHAVPLPDFVIDALVEAGPGRFARDDMPGLSPVAYAAWLASGDPARTCGLPHAKGSPCRSGLVLSTGRPLDSNNMRNRHWNPALELAGVGHTRLHDLRHTYASWLRQDGVDLETVQHLLGHGSITTTARYSHLGDTQRGKVLAALNREDR